MRHRGRKPSFESAIEPKPVQGSGEHLRLGQEIYTHICAACHGVDAGGAPADRVPRIAGQHYPYLQRQIEEGAAIHKELAARFQPPAGVRDR